MGEFYLAGKYPSDDVLIKAVTIYPISIYYVRLNIKGEVIIAE